MMSCRHVREKDRTVMYDLKTHDPEYIQKIGLNI